MFKKPLAHNLLFYRTVTLMSLLACCMGVHLLSKDKLWVEQFYSSGLYPELAAGCRLFTGWITISLGDLFYGAVIVWAGINMFRLSSKKRSAAIHPKWYSIVVFCGMVYLVFNLFWGLNYNRLGIAHQLGMKMDRYSKEELINLNYLLLNQVNHYKVLSQDSTLIYKKKRDLFKEAIFTYAETAKKYPFLKYRNPSLKPSIFSYAGNYLGFTGYYNPFSAEAQVNTTVPKFIQPFTTCHEVAHQLGYAKEMEANFVGYLAAKTSANLNFRYSVYFDMFTYANRNLFLLDSTRAKSISGKLNKGVQRDIMELRTFFKKYRNPVEPFIRWGYGIFLLSNQQPQGMLSYDEVTSFLIAYYKKFGEI